MGFGDEIIGSGLARGAAARGKRIAFGDGKRIIWSRYCAEIYRNNPNVAPPGSEGAHDLEWIKFYKNHRMYGTHHAGKWTFHDFRCPRGEFFFSQSEKVWLNGVKLPKPFVLIEPLVKAMGACSGSNKQWPISRYHALVPMFDNIGVKVVTVSKSNNSALKGAIHIETHSFREAALVLSKAALYIGPEGGLHHASAAVDTDAVVIFGGFNTPRSTGYPWHFNIVSSDKPCGKVVSCPHCKEAMESITTEQVYNAAVDLMKLKERKMA